MEENEQNRNSEQEWRSQNEERQSSEDFGLPDVSYNPLEKEERPFEHASHEERVSNRYYDYEEKRGSQVLGFVVGLLIIAALAGGLVYWFFFRDQNPKSEVVETLKEEDFFPAPSTTPPVVEEEETVPVEPAEPAKPAAGALTTISAASGSYYVVVGSFFDADLAKDHSDRLNAQGLNTYIIQPYNGNRFYRLAVDNFGTWRQAAQKMDELKSNFGKEIWVLKY